MIARDSVITVAQTVAQDIEPPIVINIQSDFISMIIDEVNSEWIHLAKQSFEGMDSELILECIQKVDTE